mgnify:CR=1 FL=1
MVIGYFKPFFLFKGCNVYGHVFALLVRGVRFCFSWSRRLLAVGYKQPPIKKISILKRVVN